MEHTLHVLNGDCTLNGFQDTGIDGDIMVWRAPLSEGPLEENIASASFWKKRREWMLQNIGEDAAGYEDKVLSELSKLNEPYEEINLWFEFDLHCQVNMLGVIMMLSKSTNLSNPAIYLICPDSFPNMPDFKGMGELNGEQLEYLYDNMRVQLGEPDFFVAAEAWQVYTTGNADKLRAWLKTSNYWGNLHCLKPAMEAHLKRIELNKAGLNHIEQKLLDIYKSGITDTPAIHEAFWQTEKIYGMGDMEINIYLDKLKGKQLID
jgi:hypothetical protein